MARWTRDEIEKAFENYQAVALEAGLSGDWNAWADQFTLDATYNEHLFGVMGGREAIRKWICRTMAQNPDMKYFPIEWYIIDDQRGWVSCQVWNRMVDPGDGSLHQAYNFTLLKYAGGGQWSYEEDVYNPTHFQTMIQNWKRAKRACEQQS